jgi:uncharacterized protein involved in exopolysaccharide biosynthesis
MSILQFFRILWARRLLIVAATLMSTLTAFVVVQVVPPRFEATSRVMLDVIKPDPVTGEVMATAFLKAYTRTQIQLLQDYRVASEVVQTLNWSKNPKMVAQYRSRPSSDDRDFDHWAAQQVIDGTNAKVIEGSNILEINYSTEDPERAKIVADALTKAYADTTLQSRREDARRNADWYEAQAEKAKDALFAAEEKKSSFEKQSGIILQDNKVDIDSARLTALASAGSAPAVAPTDATTSASANQLAELDAAIAQATKTLGPNHPQLLAMRQRRELLAKQAQNESSSHGAAAMATINAARAAASLLEEQKTKVIGQREKVEQLRLLQDDVDLRRDQYNKAVARAAGLRQEADAATAGVTLLGAAVTPQDPVFPNKPLILAGGFAAGLGLGLLSSLLLELFGRRVRSAEDLLKAIEAPVLAIVTNPNTSTGLHLRERLKRVILRSRGPRVRAARA